MPLHPTLTGHLRTVYETFLASDAPDPLQLRKIAADRQVLPVVRGWGASRRDPARRCTGGGRLRSPVQSVGGQGPRLAIGILGFCAARFPTLGALRPTRPADAYDCSLWGGTGRSENASDGICLSGGLGW